MQRQVTNSVAPSGHWGLQQLETSRIMWFLNFRIPMTRCRSACKESTEPMTYAFSSCECGGLRVKTLGLDLAYRQGDGGRQIHDLWMGPDVQRVANWGERHDYSSLKICNVDDKTKKRNNSGTLQIRTALCCNLLCQNHSSPIHRRHFQPHHSLIRY